MASHSPMGPPKPSSKPPNVHLQQLNKLVEGSAANHFQLLKLIGEGAFSSVYLGCYKDAQVKQVAIKRILKTKAFTDMNLLNECQIMRDLGRHPNVVSYLGLYTSKSSYHVVSEYMEGGELLDILINNFDQDNSYSEATVAVMMTQIVSALAHCHRHKILHRDIKPENVLVRQDVKFDTNMPMNALRLSDFGLAVYMDNAKSLNSAGTTNYMSVERLRRKPYGYPSDVWSLGVIMYILLQGQFPFFGTDAEICKAVCDPHLPKYHYQASKPCMTLLRDQLLNKNPEKRPTCDDLMDNPWMSGEVASTKSINNTINTLRLFNAKNKFRATIRALMATKRLENVLNKIRTEKVGMDLLEYGVNISCVMALSENFNKLITKQLETKEIADAVYIDKNNFLKGFREVMDLPDPNICEEFFNSFKVVKDNKEMIDPRVVSMSLVTKLAEDKEEILRLAFDIFDVTGDGLLEEFEFVNMLSLMITSTHPISQAELEEEFLAADADGNGEISREEFIAVGKSNPRITKYLEKVDLLISDTWKSIKQRSNDVVDNHEGFLHVKSLDSIMKINRWKFCAIIDGVDFCYWDEEKKKNEPPKFRVSLKGIEIWSDNIGGDPIQSENAFFQGKKVTPKFEIQKKVFEAKTFQELNAWLNVMKTAGSVLKYRDLTRKKSSMSNLHALNS